MNKPFCDVCGKELEDRKNYGNLSYQPQPENTGAFKLSFQVTWIGRDLAL